MPIPTPAPDENKLEFLRRCLSDPVTVQEFPDEAQRFAVCVGQWDEGSGARNEINEKNESKNGN
jgi:predicted nucleic acid-binding Zn ribbon protein